MQVCLCLVRHVFLKSSLPCGPGRLMAMVLYFVLGDLLCSRFQNIRVVGWGHLLMVERFFFGHII